MSKLLATKNVAAVLIGVGLVLAMTFAFATPAKGQTIADLQAQINALLAQLAALQGGTTGGVSVGACTTFTRNHSQGNSGGEVMAIQKFLNSMADTQVAASGAGSPGNETSYFGPATKAAVIKFQNKYAADILAPVGLSAGTGYWGASSRAKANALCAGAPGIPGQPGVPITGNGLKVMLAPDSPVNVALVAGQAIGELAKFTFQNPTGAQITVTNLSFQRIGVSADSTISAVYLYQGANRITDAAGISSGAFNFNNSAGVFVIPAGGSITVSVRANIAASTSGQQIGVQLNSVSASGALDTSTALPIVGGIQTISSATLGTVAFTYTGPSSATENPANDVRVFEASAVVSTHAANLEAITFENRGSSGDGDLRNFKLYVDGVQVGGVVAQAVNDRIVFDLSATPLNLQTGTRTFRVLADIIGGSSETYDIQIRREADLRVVDAELKQPILATDTGGSFPVSAGTANTIASGTLSITRAADSPNTNIAVAATNILLARFEVRAAGENVKVEAMTVAAGTSISNGGVDNGKVFVNGSQIGSTLDIAEDDTGTEFSFGSSFIARQGQTEIVEIYADAKTTTGANLTSGETVFVDVSVASGDTEGMNSGDAVTAIDDVAGFTRTVSSSSLTATKASGYGNQTMIAGTNNAKLGSFTLSAGSTEGVNVNSIVIDMSTANAASVTDLRLVDSSTGVQIGSSKVAPSSSNTYSVTIALPISGTKTIDVVGNIKSGSNAGSIILTVDSTTGGTGAVTAQSVTTGSDATLQTITLGTSGTLTGAVGAGNPDNKMAVAGSSEVKVGQFTFTAQSSSFTVQELKIEVPTDGATSVASVTLKYKDSAGVQKIATSALSLPSTVVETHATATFTGLTMHVPADSTADLDVYVAIPSIASGASTGKTISVRMPDTLGFRAVDGGGTADTVFNSGVLSSSGSGKGSVVVRKSIPTIAAAGGVSTTLSSGDTVLGRVTISADAAGPISWKQLEFTVSKADGVLIGGTTTLALWRGSTQVTGTLATTTATVGVGTMEAFGAAETSGNIIFIVGSRTDTTEEQVAASGSETYELRGSVTGVGTGDHLRISIEQSSTAVVSDQFTDIAGSIADTGHSLIWSDRSAIPHSVTTNDWADDYLVNTLPVTIGNRAAGF